MKKIFSGLIISIAFFGIISFVYYFSSVNKTTTVVGETSQQVVETDEKKKEEIVIVESKEKDELQNNEQDKEKKEPIIIEQPVIIEEEKDIVTMDKEVTELSNEKYSWSFKRNPDHEPVLGYGDNEMMKKYNAYYIGNTEEKVIYLTFDNGYENGYTNIILDTLKANEVKAAFFVTQSYIKNNKEIVVRMKEEGHIVGNHSFTHPSMPDLNDEEVYSEVKDTENYMYDTTGYKMDKFFRPPKGEYSERTLSILNDLGYKTIFWSMAYVDWDVDNQPGSLYAFDHVMTNYHPGAIPLLHSVSSSNAEALDDIIKALKEEGYRFGTLDELQK